MTDIYMAYEALPGKAGDGKAWLPLWMHLEDTAVVMKYLCARRVTPSILRAAGLEKETFCRTGEFLARTHDIGKCTPLFASIILSSVPFGRENLNRYGMNVPFTKYFAEDQREPHALMGEILLRNFSCCDGICAVVGAHHGKPSAETDVDGEPYELISAHFFNYYAKQKELWKSMQERLLQKALKDSGFTSVEELPHLSMCAQMLFCGLLIQADWIASNENYFPLIDVEEDGSSVLYPERVEHALQELSLTDTWQAPVQITNTDKFFFDRFGFEPNRVQKATMNFVNEAPEGGGLLIVEAPMGVGKTEAALASAEILAAKSGCGGLFFGLPTQATSNGIFPRIAQWADRVSADGSHTIRLVHGMAEFNEDYRKLFHGKANVEEEVKTGGVTVHSWFSGKKQSLLADFVVGTVDTVLMAAVKQKHVMLRHLGLCGKVVIIDECHAYDAYMSRYLLCLLQWLGAYQIPVILLSATLPKEKKREMIQAYCRPYAGKKRIKMNVPLQEGYPLLTLAKGETVESIAIEEVANKKAVTIESLKEEKIENVLRSKMVQGGCCGIIVNTVKRAQSIAENLRRQLPDKKVYLYHAQFIAEERVRREKELIAMIGKTSTQAQRDNVIIVGTQVLEQSLDIDFDYLITDLCPMDLLLQRMGRLHRHMRNRPAPLAEPICGVLGTEGEYEKGSVLVYGEWLLRQTRRYLPQTVELPGDIPSLVNLVYEKPEETEEDDAWREYRSKTEISEGKADNYCLASPKLSKNESLSHIVGLLDSYLESDRKAEASVRDGMPSIDVLLMRKKDENHVGFMPWICGTLLLTDTIPSEEEARKVALQKIKLPLAMSIGETGKKVIDVLEQENNRVLSLWQESPWLKGELILLLDENGDRELCGYHLHYSKEDGLCVSGEEANRFNGKMKVV